MSDNWDRIDDWDRIAPCLIRWPTALYSIGFPGDENIWNFLDRWTDPTECWYKYIGYTPVIDIESSFHELNKLAEPWEDITDEWEMVIAEQEAWMQVVGWGEVKPVSLRDLQLVFGKKNWFVPKDRSTPQTADCA